MITEESLQIREARGAAESHTFSAPAVRARELFKRYKDGTEANRGIDLDVQPGELISILGPNGAGKTTFLRQVTTELRPTSGSVEIFNLDAIASTQRAKRLMGITPQEE